MLSPFADAAGILSVQSASRRYGTKRKDYEERDEYSAHSSSHYDDDVNGYGPGHRAHLALRGLRAQ